MVRRRRTWHAIMAFEKHTRCDYVSHGHSSPTGIIHGHGVTCYHRPWTSHMIGGCRAWYACMSLGQHTWLADVRHGIPLSPLDNIHGGTILRAILSSPFGSTHGRMMSGVTCHYWPWTTHTVGRLWLGMPSSHLDRIYGWRMSREAYHHVPCPEHKVEQRRAW
uniref:Uncharacterized protein n=1 Tax=Solanum lycopersicum TaxID=4081 RepID=A0A494G8G8_SOLLC